MIGEERCKREDWRKRKRPDHIGPCDSHLNGMGAIKKFLIKKQYDVLYVLG